MRCFHRMANGRANPVQGTGIAAARIGDGDLLIEVPGNRQRVTTKCMTDYSAASLPYADRAAIIYESVERRSQVRYNCSRQLSGISYAITLCVYGTNVLDERAQRHELPRREEIGPRPNAEPINGECPTCALSADRDGFVRDAKRDLGKDAVDLALRGLDSSDLLRSR